MRRMTGMLLLGVAALLRVSSAGAQCEPRWLEGAGVSGANDRVLDMTMWDPDGAGPREPALVAAGSFTAIGDVELGRIGIYDRATGAWSALGLGMNGRVSTLAVMPNGDLIAGGSFTTADGGPARNIARWDGSAWSALGMGVDGPVGSADAPRGVYAVAVMPNGDVIAGGALNVAGSVAVNNIARWDGTAWSSVGLGIDPTGPNVAVYSLAVMPSGDLIAGGFFGKAAGVAVNNIARWNGTAWSAMGEGYGIALANRVLSMAVLPDGRLAAAGSLAASEPGTERRGSCSAAEASGSGIRTRSRSRPTGIWSRAVSFSIPSG